MLLGQLKKDMTKTIARSMSMSISSKEENRNTCVANFPETVWAISSDEAVSKAELSNGIYLLLPALLLNQYMVSELENHLIHQALDLNTGSKQIDRGDHFHPVSLYLHLHGAIKCLLLPTAVHSTHTH